MVNGGAVEGIGGDMDTQDKRAKNKKTVNKKTVNEKTRNEAAHANEEFEQDASDLLELEEPVSADARGEGGLPSAGKRKGWKNALRAVLACLLMFALTSMLVVHFVYSDQFGRADAPDRSFYLVYDDLAAHFPREVVHFQSGRNTLTGYLYGASNRRGLMVIAHGIGGGADSYLTEIAHFVEAGWCVFAYDCTGSYASEGKGTRGLSQSALDLDAALSFLEGKSKEGALTDAEGKPAFEGLPVALYGHSWGGYAVAAVLGKGHNLSAVVSVAGYNSPPSMLLDQAHSMMGAFAYVQYPFLWSYNALLFGPAGWRTALDGINAVDTPVLLLHGTSDEMIGYETTSITAQSARITNPNVEYKACATEGQNGHNSLFMSADALSYVNELHAEYNDLLALRSGSVSEEERAEFFADINRMRASALDPGFMADVDAFLDRAIPN